MFALAGSALFWAATGWAQTTTVWQETWELPSAQDNWYPELGIWKIGSPTYGPPVNAQGHRTHEGTNCATTGLNGNYPDDRQDRLEVLRFWCLSSALVLGYGSGTGGASAPMISGRCRSAPTTG